MKRFFTRLFRFFWSWGFLKFVLFVITLIVLLYVEEDWRGAREFAAAKARWLAGGNSLTPSDYCPAPISDAENLAALAAFELEPDPKNAGQLSDPKLREAIEEPRGGPLYDNSQKHRLPELLSSAYAKKFPGKTPPTSPSAQLEELYPILTNLRAEAAVRPLFQIKPDYARQTPWDRPYDLLADQVRVARLLGYDAQLALGENRPQDACDDIRVGFRIIRGTGRDPSLMGGIVALSAAAVTRANLDEGLKSHIWNDAQLAQFQEEMKPLDYLALYQFDMRADAVVISLPALEAIKQRPSTMMHILGIHDEGSGGNSLAGFIIGQFWATGWWDMNSAQRIDLARRQAECIDLKLRQIDFKLHEQLRIEVAKTNELPGVIAPWNNLYALIAKQTSALLEIFAQAQVRLDEDRIVCALERYRLAHGAYPAAMDALAPQFMGELPNDVMSGKPYQYALKADGTFLLYSVGWPQRNKDGEADKKDTGRPEDLTPSDLVWPMFKW